jgi:cbb3-type cytochrome oxidase maturation protein
MESLYILIPIAIVFLAVAIKAFLWAADNKQFDDLDQEASRILFEEPLPQKNIAEPLSKSNDNPSKDDSAA